MKRIDRLSRSLSRLALLCLLPVACARVHSSLAPGGSPVASSDSRVNRLLALPGFVAIPPAEGFLDSYSDGLVRGWFFNPKRVTAVNGQYKVSAGAEIHLYVEDPSGKLVFVDRTYTTDEPRPDVENRLSAEAGTQVRGSFEFSYRLPPVYRGQTLKIRAYGIIDLSNSEYIMLADPLQLKTNGIVAATVATFPAYRDLARWWQLHTEDTVLASQSPQPVVFLGDSITELMSTPAWGLDIWNRDIAPLGAIDMGIGGDQTQNVLYRMANGAFPATLKPKVMVLLIGTNDLGDATLSASQIFDAIKLTVWLAQTVSPGTKVLVLKLLPRGAPATVNAMVQSKLQEVNRLIPSLEVPNRVYTLDLTGVLADSDGRPNPAYFAPEANIDYLIHPNTAGYARILPAISKKLGEIAPELAGCACADMKAALGQAVGETNYKRSCDLDKNGVVDFIDFATWKRIPSQDFSCMN